MSDGPFEFKPSGDVVYTETRGDQTVEAWIYLPRIGEARKIDEYTAELSEARQPLVDEYRETMKPINRRSELTKIVAARVNRRTEISEMEDPSALELAELEELDADLARLRAEHAELSEQFTVDEEKYRESLERFNERLGEDAFKWFVRVTQVVGDRNWPKDPDDFPHIFRSTQLISRIRKHWVTAPLVSAGPAQAGPDSPANNG